MRHTSKQLKWVNLALFFVMCAVLMWGETSKAQSNQYKRKATKSKAATPAEGKKSKSGKLDISDLEQKYWAPKDTDFTVVQNRTFTKAKKFVGSLQYGMPINDPYNSGNAISFTGNYFFDERKGIQVTYSDYNLSDGDLVGAFEGIPGNTSAAKPDYGRVNSEFHIGYTWVPVYAKVSLLGKKIVYLDMAITPHIGQTSYKQLYRSQSAPTVVESSIDKTATSYGFDITQFFFFSKNFAARADIRNTFFSEDILEYTTATPTVKRTRTTNSTLFTIGVSYYFGREGK